MNARLKSCDAFTLAYFTKHGNCKMLLEKNTAVFGT